MEMLAKVEEKRMVSLAEYEARIHLYKEQIGTGYIGIGRTLNEAKEAKVVPHGQWEAWVTKTTGLTPRQAQRCMQAATEIRDGSAMARLEMSKALLLLGSGLDEEAREEIAERASEEGATVKALREEIQQAKAERQQMEDQLKAVNDAHREQLEAAREDAYKRGEGAGKLEAAEQYRKELELRDETIRNDAIVFEYNEKANQENLSKIFGLENELNKQKQYASDLLKELEAKGNAAPDADREILLQAAAEAEQRAADAEAELEALKAGRQEMEKPVGIILGQAVNAFFRECELMPCYPADLQKDRYAVQHSVEMLKEWVGRMETALETTVEAEGDVE